MSSSLAAAAVTGGAEGGGGRASGATGRGSHSASTSSAASFDPGNKDKKKFMTSSRSWLYSVPAEHITTGAASAWAVTRCADVETAGAADRRREGVEKGGLGSNGGTNRSDRQECGSSTPSNTPLGDTACVRRLCPLFVRFECVHDDSGGYDHNEPGSPDDGGDDDGRLTGLDTDSTRSRARVGSLQEQQQEQRWRGPRPETRGVVIDTKHTLSRALKYGDVSPDGVNDSLTDGDVLNEQEMAAVECGDGDSGGGSGRILSGSQTYLCVFATIFPEVSWRRAFIGGRSRGGVGSNGEGAENGSNPSGYAHLGPSVGISGRHIGSGVDRGGFRTDSAGPPIPPGSGGYPSGKVIEFEVQDPFIGLA